MQLENEKVILSENKKLIHNRELEEFELPSDECIIEVKYAGVCSSDVARSHFSGAYFYPLVMGHEFSGTVLKVGKDVDEFNIGDNVAVFPLLPCFTCSSCLIEEYAKCQDYKYYGSRNDGGFCKYISVKSWNLLISDDRDQKKTALMEPLCVAINTLKIANLWEESDSKKRVLLIGAGFIGSLIAEMLKIKNPSIYLEVVDRNDYKLEKFSENISKKTFLENSEDWNHFLEKSDKFEVIIEATGYPPFFNNSIELAQANAHLIWMSNIQSDLLIPKKKVSMLLRKELKVSGVWNSRYKNKESDDWNDALEILGNDEIDILKFVSHEISLNELPTYLKGLADYKENGRPFRCSKVLVDLKR